jgi:hypothetical protein
MVWARVSTGKSSGQLKFDAATNRHKDNVLELGGATMNAETESSLHITQQARLTAAEKFISLFQPDTLLPAQYFEDRRGKTLEAEKKLMLAVLEDAISCFQDNHLARCGRSKRLFDEAQRWIFEVKNDWIFGFENICSVLGFNPRYIRKGLVRWKEKKLSKQRRAPI